MIFPNLDFSTLTRDPNAEMTNVKVIPCLMTKGLQQCLKNFKIKVTGYEDQKCRQKAPVHETGAICLDSLALGCSAPSCSLLPLLRRPRKIGGPPSRDGTVPHWRRQRRTGVHRFSAPTFQPQVTVWSPFGSPSLHAIPAYKMTYGFLGCH